MEEQKDNVSQIKNKKRKIKFKELLFFNFKCHKKGIIDFSKNIFILLTGNNGAGKSSYIDALAWVLYDETTTGGRSDSVIRKKSGKDCFALLKFNIDDDEYEVRKYRKHHKHGNDKILFKNNVNISGATSKDTSLLIEEILMPKDIFFNCMLFSQYINKSFINLSHTGQKEILDKLLLYDKYNEYKDNVVAEIKLIDTELQKEKLQILHIKESINYLTELLKTEITNKELQIKNYNNNYSINNNKLEELNNKIKIININELNNNHDILLNDKKQNEIKLQELEFKINNQRNILISEIKQNKKEFDNMLESEKNKIFSKYLKIQDPLNKSIADINNKRSIIQLNQLEEKNKIERKFNKAELDIKKQITDIKLNYQNIIHEIENTLNNLTHRYNNGIIELKNIENELLKYKDEDRCPTCNTVIIHDEKTKKYIEEESKNLMDRYKILNIELKNIDKEKKILELQLCDKKEIYKNDLNIKNQELQTILDNKKSTLNNNEDVIKIQLHNMSEEINTLNNKIQEIKNEELIELNKLNNNIKTDMTNKDNEIKKLNHQMALDWISESNIYKNKIEILNNNLNEIIKDIAEYNKLLENKRLMQHTIDVAEENNNKILININNKINNLNNKIKEKNNEILSKEQICKEKETRLNICNFWKTAFGDTGIKSILLDEAIPILNRKSTKLSLLSNNIRVRFDSQKSLTSGDFRNKFSINVSNVKNLSELNELSAGETRLANIIVLLSLRYLLEEMTNCSINILLLDEILDSLDEENANIAVSMIKELTNEYCVILITHTLKSWITADKELVL